MYECTNVRMYGYEYDDGAHPNTHVRTNTNIEQRLGTKTNTSNGSRQRQLLIYNEGRRGI